MITRIREVRRARGMTLDDVARACSPPTTPQTIGRLETGTRTISVPWLNRIAAALGVESGELVRLPEAAELPLAALLGPDGASAPKREGVAIPPRPGAGTVAVQVVGAIGDYRSGDTIWCERIGPDDFGRAVNRDVLLPRPGGRFAFGRLLQREGGKLHLLPPGPGARQQVMADPPWAAVAVQLVRTL